MPVPLQTSLFVALETPHRPISTPLPGLAVLWHNCTIDTGVKRGSSMLTPPEERPAGEKEPRRQGRRRKDFREEQLLEHVWPRRLRVVPLLLRQSPFCETLCAVFPPPKGQQTPRASHCAYPAKAGLGRRQKGR